MERTVLDADGDLSELVDLQIKAPVRFVFKHPSRGGPAVREVREALRSRGRLRISATRARLVVDIDPGPVEEPVVALDVIARDDAVGLARMLSSALREVDEIVIGVDARSDEETRRVAEQYADVVWTFDAQALGMTDEAWATNKIDFAAARNLGRAKVRAPWTLVLDTDEYIERPVDLRALCTAAPARVTAFYANVMIQGFNNRDCQRVARTPLRWWSANHNQLHMEGDIADAELGIVHDISLRATQNVARRTAQRLEGIDDLEVEARKGNLIAFFHVAKQRLAEENLEKALAWIQDYRLRTELHGPCMNERAFLAFGLAALYYKREDFDQAKVWCLRSLLDGPRREPLCLLGEIAEDQAELEVACAWYEMACACSAADKLVWEEAVVLRWGRLAGLQLALGKPLHLKARIEVLIATWRIQARDKICADELEKLLRDSLVELQERGVRPPDVPLPVMTCGSADGT